MSSLVEVVALVLAVFIAVGMVLLTLQVRQLLGILEAINNAVERVAVALKKR